MRTLSGYGITRYGVTLLDLDLVAALLVDEQMKKPRSLILKEFTWLLTQINTQWI
jgi:hypothetical protein